MTELSNWKVDIWGLAPGDFPEWIPDSTRVRAEDWKSAGYIAAKKLSAIYGRVVIRRIEQISLSPPSL